MYNQYNLEANNSLEKIVKNFRLYLYNEDISKGSIRSYVSDTRFFLGWFYFFLESNRILRLKDLVNQNGDFSINEFCQTLRHIKPKVLEAYKEFLISNNTPVKTINRRFSSLRKFGYFCQLQNWVAQNPFEELKNVSLSGVKPLLEDKYHLEKFKTFLWQKNTSDSTIKNYLSDVKQFITWTEKQK